MKSWIADILSLFKDKERRRCLTRLGQWIAASATIYVTFFQLIALHYGMKLDGATMERSSVESLIGSGRISLAISALGSAQRRLVPRREPTLATPWTWLARQEPIFKDILHKEATVALRDYAAEYLSGEQPRLSLSRARLSTVDLHETELIGALLFEAEMAEADLCEANLTDAILNATDLRSARLEWAVLIDASLYRANLGNANLSHANLSNAYLESADLEGANLSGAILNGATLYGANLAESDLTDIESWRNIQDMRYANLAGVKSAPMELEAWALLRRAVILESEDWRCWRDSGFPLPASWKQWVGQGYPLDDSCEPEA